MPKLRIPVPPKILATFRSRLLCPQINEPLGRSLQDYPSYATFFIGSGLYLRGTYQYASLEACTLKPGDAPQGVETMWRFIPTVAAMAVAISVMPGSLSSASAEIVITI